MEIRDFGGKREFTIFSEITVNSLEYSCIYNFFDISKVYKYSVGAVGPKAISFSFDDNKIYIVMFLTILFNKASG